MEKIMWWWKRTISSEERKYRRQHCGLFFFYLTRQRHRFDLNGDRRRGQNMMKKRQTKMTLWSHMDHKSWCRHTTKKGTESQSSPGGTDECVDLETLTTTARWMLAATVQAELQRRRLKIFSPHSGRFRGFFSGTRQCTAVSQWVHTPLWTHSQNKVRHLRRLPAPPGAVVTTTLFLIVPTFIRLELPKSDKTDRKVLHERHYK